MKKGFSSMVNAVLALLVVSLPLSSWATDDWGEDDMFDAFYGDSDMVSIATGKAQPIAKAPSVATVITSEQIEKMGAMGIDEVLATVPGLHVSVEPGGYQPTYLFRGIYAQYNPQVLMLINGIPMTSLFHGNRHQIWGGMPVKAIHRIEVIRGPGSAIYGADAFAGVINVITKSGVDIESDEVGVGIGSFGERSAWLASSGSVAGGSLGAVVEYYETDGQDETIDADAQTQLDAALSTNASLAPGPVNLSRKNLDVRVDYSNEEWQFRAGYQTRRDWGVGAGVAGALDPNNRYRSDRWNADLTYRQLSILPNWDLIASVNFLDTSQRIEEDLIIYPPGVNLGAGVYPDGLIGNPEVFERHWRGSIDTYYYGIEDHDLRFGTGYYYGDIHEVRETKNFGIDPATGLPLAAGAALVDVTDTPYVFLPEVTRENYFLFVQDVWDVATDWAITTGVRYDDYSDFGTTINPRIAVVWSATDKLTTKLLYGQAFRSPSIIQTSAQNNPVTLGNPDLDPETLKNIEFVMNYRVSEALRFDATFFRYSWDDIIQFVSDSGASTSTAQNAGEQTGEGMELEVGWDITSTLSLDSSYAVQVSKDKATGSRPPQAPRHQVFSALTWDFSDAWHAQIQLNGVFDRNRASGDSRDDPDDYVLTHFAVGKKSSASDWGLQLQVRNLFDDNPVEPSPSSVSIPDDLPLAGRQYRLSFSYSL